MIEIILALPMRDVNILLDQKTHTDAKVVCALSRNKMKQFFEQAVREALDRDKDLLLKLIK